MQFVDLRAAGAAETLPASRPGLERWLWNLVLAAAVAALYYVAASLSLHLLTGTAGIAAFWPASGLAAGLAVAMGRQACLPIALGTFAGTIAANVSVGRSPYIAAAFGALNGFEAVSTAWLLTSLLRVGRAPSRLVSVLALFFASAIACILSAAGAATLLQAAGSPAPWGETWLAWLLSDFAGIALLAPLVVAMVELFRVPARNHDWSGDIALLLLFAAVSAHVLSIRTDAGSWHAIAPGALVLPILIWLSARAQPIVPAIAVVLMAVLFAVVSANGVGRYGDERVPVEVRILASQMTLTVVSLAMASISALFAERREAGAEIETTRHRLAVIADAAPGIIFSLENAGSGPPRFAFVSATATDILGLSPHALSLSALPFLDRLEEADRANLLRALAPAGSHPQPIRLEFPIRTQNRGEVWIELNARPMAGTDGSLTWHGFMQDVTTRRRLLDELNHRTRNLLSVVQSVAEHTARSTPPKEFADALGERLSGLAASHHLLAARGWEGAELGELVRSQLAHLEGLIGTQISLTGPEVVLRPAATQILGMAIHELATNACKYGALRSEQGRVDITWSPTAGLPPDRFAMSWIETGGTTFDPAARAGFGRTVTVDMAAYQLDAEVALESRPKGLEWRLSAPASQVIEGKERSRS